MYNNVTLVYAIALNLFLTPLNIYSKPKNYPEHRIHIVFLDGKLFLKHGLFKLRS